MATFAAIKPHAVSSFEIVKDWLDKHPEGGPPPEELRPHFEDVIRNYREARARGHNVELSPYLRALMDFCE